MVSTEGTFVLGSDAEVITINVRPDGEFRDALGQLIRSTKGDVTVDWEPTNRFRWARRLINRSEGPAAYADEVTILQQFWFGREWNRAQTEPHEEWRDVPTVDE